MAPLHIHRPASCRALHLLALALPSLASCSLEGTSDVPGDVHRFDPVASYSAIVAAVGPSAQLVALESRFVREDGTQDLEASYVGYTYANRYRFLRPRGQREDPSVPVGARPPAAPFEAVEVTIQKPHWVSQSINNGEPENKKHRGMQLAVQGSANLKDVVAAPGCSFARLWTAAKARGAPAGAVAVITYDAGGYQFRIDGTAVSVRFDASCAIQSAATGPGETPD